MIDFLYVWKRKSLELKYTELIYRQCGQYGVWDPSSAIIRVGDYGVRDKLTGQFIRHGNIYESEDNSLEQWARQPGHQSCEYEDQGIDMMSCESGFKIDPVTENGQPIIRVLVGAEFDEDVGAILIARGLLRTDLSRETQTELDAVLSNQSLRGKILVTEVTKCLAYALYLSTQRDKHVSFSLERGPAPEGPVPSTPLPACADTTVHWKYEAGNGHCRTEVGPDRESFTVLYKARECAKKGPLETILSWGWS